MMNKCLGQNYISYVASTTESPTQIDIAYDHVVNSFDRSFL